ncbi:RagB/SusD family nutrient uptake outer membrane protein [Hymenobacter lutimineralis]|uniref:RagB/SusD family nutrient uptake outer membrane protein n=1 Tax=Hymenobacter lutimineralis TaxID=2606448 RepID=A0A5D6V3V5_9BACT|nr:RagB/SusD family nutrient uptake outer membrane protein [Hymenobacter lutimineralis]TYZ10463.1 RagB/SusD family nutrient uptake outer membrane protein [Hymenobacter lutimineralis]
MHSSFTRGLGLLALTATLMTVSSSCVKDLDQQPTYRASAEVIYSDPAQIEQVVARLYGGLAITGQGQAGSAAEINDLVKINGDFSNYVRNYFNLQEVTTDEATLAWGDPGIPDFNRVQWTADNQFIRGMYERFYFQISACNEFLRQTTDGKLSERGISGANAEKVRQYRAEARFLRALTYTHLLDLFGRVPFVTEEDKVGTLPKQKSSAEIFAYIDSELKAIEGSLLEPGSVYGRADKGACWALQTMLYLNAEVFAKTNRYTDAITYAKKVIDSGYSLAPEYRSLFLADNGSTAAKNEIVFPVVFDGVYTQNFGGTTFLTHASVGGSMNAAEFGINTGWAGLRTKKNLVDLFAEGDNRAMFYTSGQSKEISNFGNFNDGYAVTKWRNVNLDGTPGSWYPKPDGTGGNGDFVDTDFPVFRLADVMLMYAEAVLRGGQGGSEAQALTYVNQIRSRAGASALGSLSLDEILNERGRELYWEGHRRTDLIRFGKYTTGAYVWPFKGGVPEGTAVEDSRVVFPIPSSDLIANPNVKQNNGRQ